MVILSGYLPTFEPTSEWGGTCVHRVGFPGAADWLPCKHTANRFPIDPVSHNISLQPKCLSKTSLDRMGIHIIIIF